MPKKNKNKEPILVCLPLVFSVAKQNRRKKETWGSRSRGLEGGGSERALMRQRKGTRIAMAATNGCQFCDLLTKRPSGSPRQGNRTLSTIPHISHSTKTITSIITASRERERERERERYMVYIYIYIHDSLRNRISPFQKKRRKNKQADSQTDRERERERERERDIIIIFFFLFLGKKRLVEGPMKSLAPERGNHF
jgi:hypothetical protein